MNTFVESLYKHGIAVVGAGNMGAGIAQKIAQEGFPVYLCDRTAELAESGKEKIAKLLKEAVERKIFPETEVNQILSRITTSGDFNVLSQVGLVIEAVFEEEAVKAELFQTLNKICWEKTIFATNTSSLSVHKLGEISGRPDRFGGLHFFYHPAKNRLLEVIASSNTSPATESALWDFARSLKKVAIKTSDSAGFAVNRFFVPWLNEAVRIFEEGLAGIAEIEFSAKETFKIGMGPFELMNVTGLPIASHAADSLGRTFGAFYEPALLLVKQAESGKLWDLSGMEAQSTVNNEVSERLLACVFQIASNLVDEGVASREDTDRGATVGLRWGEGPFQMMNGLGTKRAFELVQEFRSKYSRLPLSQSLKAHAEANTPWELSYVELSIYDGLARIAFNRPEAMNALNPGVTRELKERFLEAESNASVKAIVFEGIGKAFVAGADIRFFVDALDTNDFPRIYEFTKEGQDLFKSIADSKKLTVAFVNGIAYGGGAELALACQKIVVGPKAQFAFPETGIGIYPGLGGTQRLPRKIGKEYARHLIFTGQVLPSLEALSLGLADALIAESELSLLDEKSRMKACVQNVAGIKTSCAQTKPIWAELASIVFSDANVENTLAKQSIADLKPEYLPHLEKVQKTLSYKAPLALKMAHRLINSSACPSIDEGLALELASLKEIFSSEDAYEGLSSLGKRRPVYKGK